MSLSCFPFTNNPNILRSFCANEERKSWPAPVHVDTLKKSIIYTPDVYNQSVLFTALYRLMFKEVRAFELI